MFKLPFLKRFGGQDVTGIDIGNYGIKMVRLGRRAGIVDDTVSQWFYPGPLSENQVHSFREFLVERKLSGASVACNIEDDSMKIRRLDLPKMPEFDLKEAIRWQMRDVVEGPVDDYVVRHSTLEEFSRGETTRLSLVVYAIKKAAVYRMLRLLRQLSLRPVAIEPTVVSLLAAFDQLHGWRKEEFYGLVDLGYTKAHFIAIGGGKLYFSRPLTGVSGEAWKGALEKELNLSPRDSEDLHRYLLRGGLSETRFAEIEKQAEALFPGIHTQVALEIQRSINAFSLMFHKDKIHRLFLCGGCSLLPGLKDSLSKTLAIPTQMLDPAAKFQMSSSDAHLYGVALGLAL